MAVRTLPMLTHIGRTVDFRVPSNRNIVIFAGLVSLLMGGYRLLTGMAASDVVISAAGAGLFTFLAWAIGRELDPDYNLTATTAAGLMAAAVFIWPLPYLLPVGLVLTILRIVSRSTGLAPTLLDSLALVSGTGLAVALDGLWGIGLLVALMFALDTRLPSPASRHNLWLAVLTLGVTALAVALTGAALLPALIELPVLVVVLVAAGACALVIERPHPPLASVGDMTGERLEPLRVQATKVLAVVAGLLVFFAGGTVGVIALLPMWAAIPGFIGRRLMLKRGV